MTQEKYNEIMDRLRLDYELLESKGFEVVGVFLQGSQNYELEYEGSDIDTKAIVLPTFHNLVFNTKPVSTTFVLPSTEHIDIKDARVMFELWRKQNINFTELLFSKAYLLNPKYEDIMQDIINDREYIARANMKATINCIVGVMHEKQHAMTHPYPAVKDKIDAFGYDSKQLHHIMRLRQFMNRILAGEPFGKALIAQDHELLISVKAQPPLYNLEQAQEIAQRDVEWADSVRNKYLQAHPVTEEQPLDDMFNGALEGMLRRYYAEELVQTQEISDQYLDDEEVK